MLQSCFLVKQLLQDSLRGGGGEAEDVFLGSSGPAHLIIHSKPAVSWLNREGMPVAAVLTLYKEYASLNTNYFCFLFPG